MINHTGRSADLYTETFAIGDRVMAGELDGHDHGTIVALHGDDAEVAWDFSHVSTTQSASMLEAEINEDDCAACAAFAAAQG